MKYAYKAYEFRFSLTEMIVTLSDHLLNRVLGTRLRLMGSMKFESCSRNCAKDGFTMVDARAGCLMIYSEYNKVESIDSILKVLKLGSTTASLLICWLPLLKVTWTTWTSI